MFNQVLQNKSRLIKSPNEVQFLLHQSHQFLLPLLTVLDSKIDKRLVRTFHDVFLAILSFRNRSMGLVLSELGGYVCGLKKAAAGTKRISNLLRSPKWSHKDVEAYTLGTALSRLEKLRSEGKRVLMLWDDSVLEKAESWLSEGLCPVGSSKGSRLTKVKHGYYDKPKGRISVPGFKWSAVVISALGEKCSTVMMRWWTNRGKHKDCADNVFYGMLKKMYETFGNLFVHVLDRGYASIAVLERMWRFNQHFIIRWKQNHLLLMKNGKIKKTHLAARSYKPMDYRIVWDKERKKLKKISIAFAPVFHPEYPDNQLFLVIVRDKYHSNAPMYIISNVHLDSVGMAWEIFFDYIHRWHIEQTFRFMKTELAIESIRVWFFESRLKLLAILSLIYDFIVRLAKNWKVWAHRLTNIWAHRTGKRNKPKLVPLYRFRIALSLVLFCFVAQNSG